MSSSSASNYDGIDMGEGSLGFPKRITVSTETGRAWFARGWMHLANFNHLAAVECFTSCTKVEPNCAMAWWGIGELINGDTAFSRTTLDCLPHTCRHADTSRGCAVDNTNKVIV